jgi:hypothetical protein
MTFFIFKMLALNTRCNALNNAITNNFLPSFFGSLKWAFQRHVIRPFINEQTVNSPKLAFIYLSVIPIKYLVTFKPLCGVDTIRWWRKSSRSANVNTSLRVMRYFVNLEIVFMIKAKGCNLKCLFLVSLYYWDCINMTRVRTAHRNIFFHGKKKLCYYDVVSRARNLIISWQRLKNSWLRHSISCTGLNYLVSTT